MRQWKNYIFPLKHLAFFWISNQLFHLIKSQLYVIYVSQPKSYMCQRALQSELNPLRLMRGEKKSLLREETEEKCRNILFSWRNFLDGYSAGQSESFQIEYWLYPFLCCVAALLASALSLSRAGSCTNWSLFTLFWNKMDSLVNTRLESHKHKQITYRIPWYLQNK